MNVCDGFWIWWIRWIDGTLRVYHSCYWCMNVSIYDWMQMCHESSVSKWSLVLLLLFTQQVDWSQVRQRTKIGSLKYCFITCSPDSKLEFGSPPYPPCFEVCNAKAVCGIQSNVAIPNNAAQQRSQLRWNPVQRNLGGHVVHFIDFTICTDTLTTQYTVLMIESLYVALFNKWTLFMPQMILIKQNQAIKTGRH